MKTIRLACVTCERDDYDGITVRELHAAKRSGWQDIGRVQTYRQSITPSPPAESALEWYTHLGTCPDCVVD